MHDCEEVHADLQSLSAEQHCSVREHVCLLPLGYLCDAEPRDEKEAEELATALKAVLRTLQPPKTATSGGFRNRRSALQLAWRDTHRWHNFCAGEGAVPNNAACQRVVDRFWMRGSPVLWRSVSGRAFLRLHVSADALLDGQLEAMVHRRLPPRAPRALSPQTTPTICP